MHLKEQESIGATEQKHTAILDAKVATPDFKKISSSLPLGQMVPLSAISGPTYVTAQLLVQQVAYKLSDKIFSYSPETFDLDVAAKNWSEKKEDNIHGYPTTLVPLETRTGAGAFALGYIFSKDFDLSKRTIPQSVLAPSLSLNHLRAALDQLSLLYGVASPFVAHVAAAEYSDKNGLYPEYNTALQLSEELGLGLVSSGSAYEAQHMSILATLMASIMPTLHIYDGVRTSRETLRVIDTLGTIGVRDVYSAVLKAASTLNPRLDEAGKVLELFKAFNDHLGTDYQPFEYHGHKEAETVLVVFGSAEAQLAQQVSTHLAANGVKVGAVNVRLYRPFVEEAFIAALPSSVKKIAVLGQASSDAAVSLLYSDVLTAVSFSDKLQDPSVVELKYSASDVLTPKSLCEMITGVAIEKGAESGAQFLRPENTLQFSFWDLDNSASVASPSVLGHVFSRQSTANVYVHETHDNLVQGGIIRTDIRVAKRTIEAPYPVQEADVAFIGEEKLLKELDVISTVAEAGKLIVKLFDFKEEDVEKRIPPVARQQIQQKGIQVFVFDPSSSSLAEEEKTLTELAFLKLSRPEIPVEEYIPLILSRESAPALADALEAVETSLRQIEVPEAWATLPEDVEATSLPAPKNTSFVGFEKEEVEETPELTSWEAAAKALVFKEAYAAQDNLRPDLNVKTFTVKVKENRRLTPDTYDRNIFHIEFDLGTSGLTYQIGEALGIHSENDPALVQEFIDWYGLEAGALVQVPSRESESIQETRTVYQALVQNVDLYGKPPKRFYEALSEFATDAAEKQKLADLGSAAGAEDFKKRSDVDTATFADILTEFKSAHPCYHDLARIVGPLKRREYSIASAQAVTPNSVSLMIVVVDWTDGLGRKRLGHATRYLSSLAAGASVTVSVKPSVMKLPVDDKTPLIMAGLGTGLAPFRAFVQHRAMQKAAGKEIGDILLYMGSRHQREEYLYGEEWEAYVNAGVVTLLGAAFSRDQAQKIYIQDRMRQTIDDIVTAYVKNGGSFYLCGPTWPVPDVTAVLEEAIAMNAKAAGKKCDPRKEIEKLKEEGRYVLEVY
ncbi:putative sulfite reductase flavoprotein component protein [Zalerion maritima]|uniref:assimilatory sulfite reductase (NADPH) n=1 Tax=Zalerion maritima TaxID=339359 RepID=A0AAD5RTS7_9PEZI|nr:putative sulfite reductase flavoprotein component protein [Zalerion maritima]